jgi:hypothetical protein
MTTPPKATFRLEWLPGDESDNLIVVAKVWAHQPGAEPRHVGDLMFNGNEWLFYRIDRVGDTLMETYWIPVDPGAESADRSEHIKLRVQDGTIDGAIAALNFRRKVRRDETRDLAELGAKMEARKWWRDGYWGDEWPEIITGVCPACEKEGQLDTGLCLESGHGDGGLCRTCGAWPGENCRLPAGQNCVHPMTSRSVFS